MDTFRFPSQGRPEQQQSRMLQLGATLSLLAIFLTGCIIGESVTYQPAPGAPPAPKDHNLLRLELDDGVDLADVGASGSVWHLRMAGPPEGMVFDHVMVLYPDGRCFTTLHEERDGRWYISPGTDEESIRERAEHNAKVTRLIQSKDPMQITNLYRGGVLRYWGTHGRYSAMDGKIRANLLEQHSEYGVGILMYDMTGVSQLVFIRQGDGYVLDQDESRPIWWSPEDNVGRIFRQENLTLNAVRSRVVTIRRIDGFAPPPLPADWKW